jgi:DNA polymerase III delta prime subunit
LFTGPAGTGKTTLAKIIIKQLGVFDHDVMEINASRENSVDIMRDKIVNFISTMPFGDFKIVLLDEMDFLSGNAQAILRNAMETYHHTARFILTGNFAHKILPAIHSRCQGFNIEKSDIVDFTSRIAKILLNENIEFDLDTLDTYVKSTYPDLRKCINTCQQHSTSGKLIISNDTTSSNDYKFSAVDLIKNGKYKEARQLIVSTVRPDEIDELFTWCYNNLELWADTDDQKDAAVLVLRNGLVNHAVCADPEINLAATLIELSQV